MKPPFTADQFVENLSLYNESIWPIQIVGIALCLVLSLLVLGKRVRAPLALGILSLLWLWIGFVFQAGFHSRINPIGIWFAAAFVVQGLFFATMAFSNRAEVRVGHDFRSVAGAILILYAAVGYPALGLASGRVYPELPLLGVTPCPTTIFSLGVMLLFAPSLPWWLFIIPLLWTGMGTGVIRFGMYEDIGLPAAGALTMLSLLWRRSDVPHSPSGRARLAGSG